MLHLYANNALIDTTLGCAAYVYMYGFSVDLPLVIGGFGGIRSGTTEIVGTSLISMTLEVPRINSVTMEYDFQLSKYSLVRLIDYR